MLNTTKTESSTNHHAPYTPANRIHRAVAMMRTEQTEHDAPPSGLLATVLEELRHAAVMPDLTHPVATRFLNLAASVLEHEDTPAADAAVRALRRLALEKRGLLDLPHGKGGKPVPYRVVIAAHETSDAHLRVTVESPDGRRWVASWAGPYPVDCGEALDAWNHDTRSGTQAHRNWVCT